MKRVAIIAMAASAALLGACHQEAKTTDNMAATNMMDTNAAAPVDAGNNSAAVENYSAAVLNLNQNQLGAVFIRALEASGSSCQHVKQIEKMPPMDGNPTWRATCDDGNQHLISVAPDGTAKVVSRTDTGA